MNRPSQSAQPVEEKLFRCWHGGMSIGETRDALRRTHSVDLSVEDVRMAFVNCCDNLTGEVSNV